MDTAATVIGGLLLIVSSLVLAIVNNIRGSLKELNGRFYNHVMDAGLHEAGIARVEEKVKAVDQTARVAHKRIDEHHRAG